MGKLTHGMSYSPEYRAWKDMKARCYRKTNKNFRNYGHRGITICDEWLNSFEMFLMDMGPRPSKKFSIDRIDNEKGYFKGNCEWRLRLDQLINRRNNPNTISGKRGIRKSRNGRFEALIQINKHQYYIGSFETIERAIDEFNNVYTEWYGKLPPTENKQS